MHITFRHHRRTALTFMVSLLGALALAGPASADTATLSVNDPTGKPDPASDGRRRDRRERRLREVPQPGRSAVRAVVLGRLRQERRRHQQHVRL
jgi:hypothetical protein